MVEVLDPSYAAEAMQYLLTPENMILIVVVTLVGIILGAMPGVGTALTLAIAIPFTFTMSPEQGLMIMAVLYGSATYGGSISAILVNIPGTPGSTATLLDGYPMTRRGEGAKAISTATMSSFIGGLIGLTMLMFLAPMFASVIVAFGQAEFFMLSVFGLTAVSAVTKGSMMKSFAAMCLGVVFATVGTDPIQATERFTFDTLYLQGGIELIVLAVGLFAIAQAFDLILNPGSSETVADISPEIRESLSQIKRSWFNILRSAGIGGFVGTLPGLGITPANFLSYLAAVGTSKNPESFGSGNPDGVIAAEASNNSAAMGALVPAMAFGIPGGAAAAIFIGSMISFGIAPGPTVFEGDLPFIIFIGVFLSNVVFLFAGLLGAKYFARVTTLPSEVILTGIVVLSLVGAYTTRNNIMDVGVAVAIGLLGFMMMQKGYSRITFILGFILAPIAEGGFQRAMLSSRGDISVFWESQINKVLIVLSLILFFTPILWQYIQYRKRGAARTVGS